MHLFFTIFFSYASLALCQNDTQEPNHHRCTNPRIRKSWHGLSTDEKLEYIRAVKCLWSLPPQGTDYFPAVQNRHDDFSSLHINQTSPPDPTRNPANFGVIGPGIHFNGVFLPWHRYTVWAYENVLINECDYDGAQPYWDWTIDTPENGRHFDQSIIFDPDIGFGGNGKDGTVPSPPGPPLNTTAPPPGSCIDDGPFADFNASIGWGYSFTPNPHCIIRNFNVSLADKSLQWFANVQPLLRETDYFNFTLAMSISNVGAPSGVHGGGHSGVGGEMRNVWSSINDPLFYMHHAQIDHIWSTWQKLRPENQWAVNGPVYPDGRGNTTLDSPIYMTPFIAPDQPIWRVMDTLNRDGQGILCYDYEDDGHPLPEEE